MALRFSEHRFLAKDAPQLPLTGCTMRSLCECRYIKHRDRRGESRRFVDFSSAALRYVGSERRHLLDRRSRD
jgi:hypothetical protein